MRTIMSRFNSLLDTSFDFAPSFALIASAMGESFVDIHPTVMTTIINAIRAPLYAHEGLISDWIDKKKVDFNRWCRAGRRCGYEKESSVQDGCGSR